MQNDVKATNQIATLSLTFAVTLATILNIIFEPTPCTIYALAKIRFCKNSSEYSRVHNISGTDNHSNRKRLNSIPRWGVFRNNLFNFSNILKIRPRYRKIQFG